MPVNRKIAAAGVLVDFITGNPQVKGILPSRAQVQTFKGKFPDEALRFRFMWKPGGPDLDWKTARVSLAAASPGIHEQIAKPPGAAAIRQG